MKRTVLAVAMVVGLVSAINAEDAKTKPINNLEEVKKLYEAERYREAYKLASGHKTWSFLYGKEREAKEEGVNRFLRLTEGTNDLPTLGYRCKFFAGMNPIPPEGIDDAKKLSEHHDWRYKGNGLITLAADARNRGDKAKELDFVFKSILTVLNKYSAGSLRRIALLYDKEKNDKAALAFRILGWYVLKDSPANYWYKGISKEIADDLEKLGKSELANKWLKWVDNPLKSGVFPLYGVYEFPAKWKADLKVALEDFDRTTAYNMWRYTETLYQLGRIDEAMDIMDKTLQLKHPPNNVKAMESSLVEWEKWSEVFPQNL